MKSSSDTDIFPKIPIDEPEPIYGYKLEPDEPESKLKASDIILVVALCLVLCAFSFIMGLIVNQEKVDREYAEYFATKVHAIGPENAGANAATISDIVNATSNLRYYVPLYMQWDSQWANVPYGVGTISDTGCGLCCGAMAVQMLTGTTCTPDELAKLSSGATLTDGVNDINKTVDFIRNSWGAETNIKASEVIYAPDAVAEMVNNDWIAFASCHGVFGDMETSDSGHIVLIYDVDENGFYIRDPYCITNNRQFSFEEFNSVAWDFFRCMKGEHVVRRH